MDNNELIKAIEVAHSQARNTTMDKDKRKAQKHLDALRKELERRAVTDEVKKERFPSDIPWPTPKQPENDSLNEEDEPSLLDLVGEENIEVIACRIFGYLMEHERKGVVISGPSGSGKTMIMEAIRSKIAGLLQTTNGDLVNAFTREEVNNQPWVENLTKLTMSGLRFVVTTSRPEQFDLETWTHIQLEGTAC